MADEMKTQKQSYRLEFRADGKTFATWHILADNYFDAVYNAQCKMTVYMAHKVANTISFEVFAE